MQSSVRFQHYIRASCKIQWETFENPMVRAGSSKRMGSCSSRSGRSAHNPPHNWFAAMHSGVETTTLQTPKKRLTRTGPRPHNDPKPSLGHSLGNVLTLSVFRHRVWTPDAVHRSNSSTGRKTKNKTTKKSLANLNSLFNGGEHALRTGGSTAARN